MYPRKKPNRSGMISVVVVSKSQGQTRYVHNFGTAKTDEEADALMEEARRWICSHGGQQELDFEDVCGKEREETVRVLDNMDAVIINGTQLLLNRIYDSMGLNLIPDGILRHLVVARVSQPGRRFATVAYLKSYYDEDVSLNHIYRYMDKLYNSQKELVQQIGVEHTRKILGGNIGADVL